ncbi:MAG TPA: penicillin acylase family protein [Thermoanaerobaculia bacterium]|nr:penicillin acylase family protein [Thermoanaerobaculia bacterium]
MAQALNETPSPRTSPPAPRRGRRILRRIGKSLLLLLGVLVLVLAVGALWVRSQVKASLPRLNGEMKIAGLSAPATVERDALGVPTIRAANPADVARALGFLHAQDRFFQMDLMRRSSAGELSALVGDIAIEIDQEVRVHRFRRAAARVIEQSGPEERAVTAAYAEGVNAGLAALGEKPWEYLALRVDPAPWKPEDSILVVYAMFLDLQGQSAESESSDGLVYDLLPQPLAAFLRPVGTEWDAPIVGQPIPTPPIPGPEVFDLRREPAVELPKAASLETPVPSFLDPGIERTAIGSNNWAVAGTHTADGRALLADDMHLGIRVPNTWYRASLVRPDGAGGEIRITGVTLPGTPAVAVGSNGHVAWGFTNSYGDFSDLIILEVDPKDPEVYRSPQGPRRFTRAEEVIEVKGGEPIRLEVRETIWGPVVDKDHLGRPRALAWTAHRPQGVNLAMTGLDTARTLEEAFAIANRSGAPGQNFVAADSTGRIGWTIFGRLPRRVGFDGRLPTSWADGTRRWDGWLPPEETPRVIDPPSGRIWTANNRVVDGDMLARLGNGGFAMGARARQIRDGLMALDKATREDMLKIQLDDRALYMDRWRKVLLGVLTDKAVAGHPQRAEMRRLVQETWTGRASVDSAGYRMVRAFRNMLGEELLLPITARCLKADEDFFLEDEQTEGPLWKLVTERPAHLLDPKYKTWDEKLASVADVVIANFEEQGKPTLAERTWGERNTTRIQHPLGGGIPVIGRWVNVPARPLPGDQDMPRVQGAGFGASERLVVSPGHEEDGFFHMPVGQSGHPMSPFYLAGHKAWEEGTPSPFLPGQTEHTLRLVP